MIELNESQFDDGIKDGLVLVDFYTPSCGPCRALAPVLEQLKDIKVVKVNVSDNPSLATRYAFSAVPTLIFTKDGSEVARMVGMQPKEVLQKKIDELK
jgi:thioredoxin 1